MSLLFYPPCGTWDQENAGARPWLPAFQDWNNPEKWLQAKRSETALSRYILIYPDPATKSSMHLWTLNLLEKRSTVSVAIRYHTLSFIPIQQIRHFGPGLTLVRASKPQAAISQKRVQSRFAKQGHPSAWRAPSFPLALSCSKDVQMYFT